MAGTPQVVTATDTPISGAALVTLSLGTMTLTTPYGFASKADADALVAQVMAINAALVTLGLSTGTA